MTIRTPEVALGSGKLWYLVKGSGRAYAVVNSHLIVSGPLHGNVFREWQGKPDEWQWIEHDLSTYAGHRAHVEFSPLGDNPLAIARVVDSAARPANVDLPNRLVTDLLSGPAGKSLDALAAGYQQLYAGLVEQLRSGKLAGTPHAADVAQLADWLLAHDELWSPAGKAELDRLAELRKTFVERQAELVRQVPAESHAALAMLDGNGVEELLLVRGNSRMPADPVPRRLLEAIAGSEPLSAGAGSGRLELAQALLAPSAPPAARVMVNRSGTIFRAGDRGHGRQLWRAGRGTDESRAARLSGRPVPRRGWSLKGLIRSSCLAGRIRCRATRRRRAGSAGPSVASDAVAAAGRRSQSATRSWRFPAGSIRRSSARACRSI